MQRLRAPIRGAAGEDAASQLKGKIVGPQDVTFDASLLHAGTNAMTLTVPAGGVMSGIAYDVVRLEVGEGK
jgi:hypothetical protein